MQKTISKNIFITIAGIIALLVIGSGFVFQHAHAQSGGFTIITRTLIYLSNGNGTIQGTTPQTVVNGSSGTPVTAISNAGYVFNGWSDGVSSSSRTDTNVTANKTVSANFVLAPSNIPSQNLNPNLVASYTLSYSAPSNQGLILGTNPQTVFTGTSGTTVTAVPKSGYSFIQWSDGVISAARTDTNVTANKSVAAQFQAQLVPSNITTLHTVTYNVPSGRGYIQGDDYQIVADGDDGTLVKAIAYSGYSFDEWSDGVSSSSRTDYNIDDTIEVSALFRTNSSGGGSSGSQTADEILGSGVCPLTLTLTQKLKSGAHDGEYLSYTGGIVTQVTILQKQINRILAASYNQAAGPIDGRFGPLTKLGVQRLQLALLDILHADLGPKGADGIVGPYTRAAMNNSCGGM